MAKKKNKEPEAVPAATKQKPNRNGYPIHAWMPPDIGEAFNRYLASLEIEPTATAVVTAAIREFLTKRGFWPPPS
jgi:hypothetical protein